MNSHLYNKTTNPPRLFIALFDYDPNAMSPNKDNEEDSREKKRKNLHNFCVMNIYLFCNNLMHL